MTNLIKKIYRFVSVQFGIDPRRTARSLKGIPRFIADLFRFRKEYNGPLNLYPCLHDWYDEGGSTKDEYFLQDLYVARKIYLASPTKHVDIGSRIDGFVAHLASFREIEVFDIRPVTSHIPGIIFRQADLMNPSESLFECCDSLSCLHALEHFGLGRYGDPIDPLGYVAGLRNMVKILRPGGTFYLSIPVGVARVEFNAHRIFDPNTVVQLVSENALLLKEFAWVGMSRTIIESTSPVQDIGDLSKLRYALGIFTFVKQ